MKIAKIDNNGDWIFGRGFANYATDEACIEQDVVTKLKCFVNDWFLDTENYIDWDYILSIKNNQDIIINEITRVVLNNDGVITLNYLNIDNNIANRKLNITLNITTIFNNNLNIVTGVSF